MDTFTFGKLPTDFSLTEQFGGGANHLHSYNQTYTPSFKAQVFSMSMWIATVGQQVKGCIYRASDGKLMGVTKEAISNGGLIEMGFTSPFQIDTVGYWFGISSTALLTYFIDVNSSFGDNYKSVAYGVFPDPISWDGFVGGNCQREVFGTCFRIPNLGAAYSVSRRLL